MRITERQAVKKVADKYKKQYFKRGKWLEFGETWFIEA